MAVKNHLDAELKAMVADLLNKSDSYTSIRY
jgi:hypothetical protein